MVSIEQLKLFIAVVESGSFRQAVTICHKSQPAISKAIQSLESQLNVKLLSRDAYRPTLTEDGLVLLKYAKQVLFAASQLQETAAFLNTGETNKLHIAIDDMIPIATLRPTLDMIATQYPTVEIEYTIETLGGGIDKLVHDQTDMAITENLGGYSNLESVPIYKTDMIPVATPAYVQSNKINFQDPNKLHLNRQIIVTDSSTTLPKYNFGLIENSQIWSVPNFALKKELILAGYGWGRLPLPLVDRELMNHELILIQERHIQSKPVTISIIRKNDKKFGACADLFWHTVIATFQEYLD